MKLCEIIGFDCGTGTHYDPIKKTLRTNKKKKVKITLKGLRKMNLLKARQKKLDSKRAKMLVLQYSSGTASTESELSNAAEELKSQSHIDKLAMNYVKRSYK